MKIKESTKEFIKRKEAQFQVEKENKKIVWMKDRGRRGSFGFIKEAWTFMPQHNFKDKVFVVEKLRTEKSEGKLADGGTLKRGKIEYRIGYYIVGKIGRAKNKWVWGQFCPLIPENDLMKLINKAKREKTIK